VLDLQAVPTGRATGRGDRILARQGPRPGCDGARAAGRTQEGRLPRVRRAVRPRARAVRRNRLAGRKGRSVDPGAGARPVGRARFRRRLRRGRGRTPGQGSRAAARHQAPRIAPRRAGGQPHGRHHGPDGRGCRPADAQPRGQGRRAWFGAGTARGPDRPVQRPDPHQRDRRRRRWHHRIRRHAAATSQGHGHRLQRPCRRLGPQGDRRQRRRPALLLDHL
jgi:hypothetical protein